MQLKRTAPRTRHGSLGRRGHRGLSIVELLVGLTVGMFVIGGTLTLFATNVNNSRKLLVEARLNQDLRAAADLITRDLRRAGYWGDNAINGTLTSGSSTTSTPNPYSTITVAGTSPTVSTADITNTTSTEIDYSYSQDATVDALGTADQLGFRLNNGVIQMQRGASGWQSMTDPNVITVTGFSIARTVTPVDVGSTCATPCTIASSSTCPRLLLRTYVLKINASVTGNSAVTRQLQTQVKARNDEYYGVCPT